ncbi:Glutamate--tRNA ligase mitochondrial, partial [Toensbergia leucococca]|nr:Glutamate--tRNA ligase mitochondrial [Toensbergia leucococca]
MGRASGGEPHTVRLRVPDIYPEYSDLVYGLVGKQNRNTSLKYSESAYEDPILLKSDGLPTYHLANVVDDHTMEISHVIRAVEWMPSTPKHLMLYNAFGWKPPNFAHVGLLQDISRQKLSKRNMDLDIRSFDRDGIFPEALVNYVALLGWSHTLGSDVLSLPDLIKNFNLKFTKGNTVVDFKKLLYLQAKHAQKYSEEDGAMFESLVDRVFNTVREHLQAQP